MPAEPLPDSTDHGHTPPDPDVAVPAGVGTTIAGWTIAAMAGSDVDAGSLAAAEVRRLRRVQAAVAALRASAAHSSGKPT